MLGATLLAIRLIRGGTSRASRAALCLASAANGGITLVLAKAVSTLIVCFFSFPFFNKSKNQKSYYFKKHKGYWKK